MNHDIALDWHRPIYYNTPHIIDMIVSKFPITRDQLIRTEIFEVAILKGALVIDAQLSSQITPEDIARVVGTASWFAGSGYLIIDYPSLSHEQCDAVCRAYQKHYDIPVLTKEEVEHTIYQKDENNNSIVFPMTGFLNRVMHDLPL